MNGFKLTNSTTMRKIATLHFPYTATPETCGLPEHPTTYRAKSPDGTLYKMDCYRATVLALYRRGWTFYDNN